MRRDIAFETASGPACNPPPRLYVRVASDSVARVGGDFDRKIVALASQVGTILLAIIYDASTGSCKRQYGSSS